MSATYNWAYKPGVTNKYGFSVAAGTDTAQPSNCVYVALFGNDTTGNGSRQSPYKTISKGNAVAASKPVIVASGVYREAIATSSNGAVIIYGDGDVVIDGTANLSTNPSGNFGGNQGLYYNVTFSNFVGGAMSLVNFTDCIIKNCKVTNVNISKNNIFINLLAASTFAYLASGITNSTFINCIDIQMNKGTTYYIDIANIFYNCNIWFAQQSYIDYSIFYQCNVIFNAARTLPTTFYPTTPTGYTKGDTLAHIQAAHLAGFPTPPNNFPKCAVADPLFNNVGINDVSLQFGSPAKNMAYQGTYIGAKSIAYLGNANATESLGVFDFSTNVNLTIGTDSITFTNPAINAEIKTKCLVNTVGRQLSKISFFGFNADRNGQYIDSIADLDTVTIAAGTALTVPASYIVEVGSITYNSGTYAVGDRFTTVTGVTTFTTSTSGVVRQILEAPQRHTLMMRVSDGLGTISAGTALVNGNWYFVTGSVTYDAVVYTNQVFKAVDTNAFTGSGVVVLAFDSTVAFQHYEPGIQPTTNNTGDLRTGSILRGNGDPAYVRGGLNVQEFPVANKFIQLYFIFQSANLKP